MDDAVLVSVVDGMRQQVAYLCGCLRRLRRALEARGEAAAFHILQRKIRDSVGLTDLVYLYDVGMLQARHRLRFGAKARQQLRAGMGPGQDHLQRHQPLEAMLPCFVNDAHSPPAKHRE